MKNNQAGMGKPVEQSLQGCTEKAKIKRKTSHRVKTVAVADYFPAQFSYKLVENILIFKRTDI